MTWIALSIYSETGYRSFYFTEEVSLCATVSKRAKKKLGIFRKVIGNEASQKTILYLL